MVGIPTGLTARIRALCGAGASRRLARWSLLLPAIQAQAAELERLDDAALRKQSLALRFRAKSGEPLRRLLPEAFALCREAGRRTQQMRHFDVQMLGGIAMCEGGIVEMQTGEGKTLTATLPLYLHALEGRGAYLATSNDYLAQRDADWMKPLYEALGLSVGVITADTPDARRRLAYACDVTYGTAKELGFDFLRDQLLLRGARESGGTLQRLIGREAGGPAPVGRGHHFALVDEADSLLIDEARTPLVISALPGEQEAIIARRYRWAAEVAPQFLENEHYVYQATQRRVELNAAGRQRARALPKPAALDACAVLDIYEFIERAVKVRRDYLRDRHYIVREGEVVIVDEFTGRLGEGRKWRDGIHQAIEAKEGVEVTVAAGQAAQITIQELFRRFPKLAGMTGTASTSARELSKVYRLRVSAIPTHRPPRRQRLPDLVFDDAEQKFAAMAREVAEMHAAGRPVLIGARSIDKSERLSQLLRQAGVPHDVLNAKHPAQEAAIVAQAGCQGKVTVATNMAGRGTDIKLGPGVGELGGLHVICSEMHESARIDRQLIGRCGRQGDPGSYRQYLALDDDLLIEAFGPQRVVRWKKAGVGRLGAARVARLFQQAQARVERRHYKDRRLLMHLAQERSKLMLQMGQDPFLDTPG